MSLEFHSDKQIAYILSKHFFFYWLKHAGHLLFCNKKSEICKSEKTTWTLWDLTQLDSGTVCGLKGNNSRLCKILKYSYNKVQGQKT